MMTSDDHVRDVAIIMLLISAGERVEIELKKFFASVTLYIALATHQL